MLSLAYEENLTGLSLGLAEREKSVKKVSAR